MQPIPLELLYVTGSRFLLSGRPQRGGARAKC